MTNLLAGVNLFLDCYKELVKMDKEEMKNKISMELKNPITQQGFEIICKNLAELEKEKTELNRQLSDIVECFQSASSGDDFEMAESAREIMEILDIPCYRHGKVKSKLSEAKELIKNIIRVTWGEGWNYDLGWKVKAEQFINEKFDYLKKDFVNKSVDNK